MTIKYKADKITVAHFRMNDRENIGRMIHNKTYDLSERDSLINEAIEHGFDIMFTHSKVEGYSHTLWYSANGFHQR